LRADLDRYLELLLRKNEEVNLTALRDPEVAFWKHLVDSLTILQMGDLGNVVDWGSGGGLPGIPLALVRRAEGSSSGVSFLDSVGKKIRAVEEFGQVLGLKNSQYFNGRGEQLLGNASLKGTTTIVMRAVAPAERAVTWLDNRVGRWLYLLGPQQLDLWIAESKSANKRGFGFGRTVKFDLPHGHGQRVILELLRK
jgi:16S rRNA (guanine527-N7)-methyltransferase